MGAVENEGDTPVLLYDGSCGLCSRTVRFVLEHDRRGRLHFAALQSGFADRVFAQHPELQGCDSVVWFDQAKGEVLTKSAAVLRVSQYLKGVWQAALVLRLVPRRILDWGYDLLASHRHLLVGRGPACWVPPVEERHRFLGPG